MKSPNFNVMDVPEWSDLYPGSMVAFLRLESRFSDIRIKSNLACLKGFFLRHVYLLCSGCNSRNVSTRCLSSIISNTLFLDLGLFMFFVILKIYTRIYY